MGVIMLDYGRSFDEEILVRLADAGCKEILLFDSWYEHEPLPGIYRFDALVNYARKVRELGMFLRVQTPVGVPFWCPKEWFLENAQGSTSDFTATLAANPEPENGQLSHDRMIALGLRILSYWNSDAEAHLRKYVARVRRTMEDEGAVCISSIGACGEYLFPSVHHYPFLGTASSPWWHDAGAQRSWQEYSERHCEPDRGEWLFEQLSQITEQRLALYSEKWLQYVPYFQGWGNFGLDNVNQVLKQNRDGLHTVLFTVFQSHFAELAAVQAAKYPTWGGAQGAANVSANSRRAYEIGLKGLVCGPLWFDFSLQMEPWMYDQIREANDFWQSVEA